MSAPLIGITTYARDQDERFSQRTQYVDAVRRAGGMAVLVPPGDPRVEALLARLDGLIFAGGGDIDPALYGGRAHPEVYSVNRERDETEIALARRVVSSGTPTLGICRGTQILNVALGGTLHEHLPDVVGDRISHRSAQRLATRHPVSVKAGSRLAEILGTTALEPSSWHHQAVRTSAPGLEVVASAPDGTIEACELASHPWLVAVQWHPETRAAEDPIEQRLFDAFVQAAMNRTEKQR